MALKQLATFEIVTSTGIPAPNLSHWIWYQGVGLISDIASERCVITLDGVYEPVAGFFGIATPSWWATQRLLIHEGGDGNEFSYEPKALLSTLVATDAPNFLNRPYVRLADRRVYFHNEQIYAIPLGSSIEAAESPLFPFPVGDIFAGRGETDLFVVMSAGGNTYCCFYDTEHRIIASPIMQLGMTCDGLVYAPEFGVLVSLHLAGSPVMNHLRVWSLEVASTVLTNPQLIAGAVTAGRVATFQVQVQGAGGEGSPNVLVDWTVTGPGRLLIAQSETDTNGFATTQVRYDLMDTGNSVIGASVTC